MVIPDNYLLKKAEHYEEYKPTLIQVSKWFLDKKKNEELKRHIKAKKFIMDYAQGCPDLSITLNKKLVSFPKGKESTDLMVCFLAGYMINAYNQEEQTEFDNNLAAVNAMLDYYSNNKSLLHKDKLCDKLLGLRSKNKLNDYVLKNTK